MKNPAHSTTLSLLALTCLTAFFAITADAQAGGISDGGGNAVVCRNKEKKIKSAALLDLYEAVNLHRRTLSKWGTKDDYLKIAQAIAAKIDIGGGGQNQVGIATTTVGGKITDISATLYPEGHGNWVSDGVSELDRQKYVLPYGVGLEPIGDSNGMIRPEFCNIEQVAAFVDNNDTLTIVRDIWNAFSKVDKAALLVHETLYRMLRQNGETSSARARMAVGFGFSGYDFQWNRDGLPQAPMLCLTEDAKNRYVFAATDKNDGTVELQFLLIDGLVMLTKTTLLVPKKLSPFSVPGDIPPQTISYTATYLRSPLNDNPKIAYGIDATDPAGPTFRIATFATTVGSDLLYKVVCH